MKLAIIGGRDFNDPALLASIIHNFLSPNFFRHIVSGGAKGADSLGAAFAKHNGLKLTVFPPQWAKYSKSAGFVRNQTIVDNCDMLLAFWDGKSQGTADTIAKARKAKKPTFIVYY